MLSVTGVSVSFSKALLTRLERVLKVLPRKSAQPTLARG